MADKPKIDVRAATEWAWLQSDNCIIRNEFGIAVCIDVERATTEEPLGGKMMMDMAFSNKVAFNTHSLKVLGNEIDGDDETATKEKKLIADLQKLLERFEDAGKKT